MKTKHKVTIMVSVIAVIGSVATALIAKDWGNQSSKALNSSVTDNISLNSSSKTESITSESFNNSLNSNMSVQGDENKGNNITQQGNGITNNIVQQGDGNNEVNIYPDTINTSINEEHWQIELLNKVDKRIEIGEDLILDFAINTPPSQFSTPYILYAAYYLNNDWVQFYSMRIPAGQSHIKLTIDTYKLGIKGTYFFSFDLFRAEDYSEGNSCASYFNEYTLSGENAPYSGSDNVFYRSTTKYEILDYYSINDQKYSMDTESLVLSDIDDIDIKSIAFLCNLKELSISGTNITDIKPLENLKNLKSLSIHSNQLSDIDPIKTMQNLESLSIGGENHSGMGTHGALKDISPIQNLTKLKSLTIYDCDVDNIECIGQLKMLQSLLIFKTEIKDISPLSELHFVEYLYLHRNKIEDISTLYNLPNLVHVTLSYNYLTDDQIADFKESHPNCYIVYRK